MLGEVQFSSVQSLSRVRLFATPWIAARQASLSITNSGSWWQTGSPGVLQSMGSQSDTTEQLNWTEEGAATAWHHQSCCEAQWVAWDHVVSFRIFKPRNLSVLKCWLNIFKIVQAIEPKCLQARFNSWWSRLCSWPQFCLPSSPMS